MEITASASQNVAENANVLFNETPVPSKCKAIIHREGSGLVTLRGLTDQNSARFLVTFGANVATEASSGGTINLALAIDGEAINSSSMIVTPTAADAFFNVASSVYICVPKCCCQTISVENLSGSAIIVQNANLIVTRVA